MRRSAIIAIVFILFGCAATVLIGWAFAMLAEPRAFDPQLLAAIRREHFDADKQTATSRTFWPVIAYPGCGVDFIEMTIDEPNVIEDPVRGPMPAVFVVQSGWPWRAIEGRWEYDSSSLASTSPPRGQWSIVLRSRKVQADRMNQPRLLPLRPMLPGLAADAAFIGAMLMLLWLGARWLKQTVRIRRGLCPHCAYPIGISLTCTECGRAVRRRPATLIS